MKNVLSLSLFGAFLLIVTACSTTTVTQSWKDAQFTKPVGKVLVLGISENDAVRRSFEQQLGGLLAAEGVEVVAGYTLLPEDKELSKEQVTDVAQAYGVQTVLLTRVASIKRMKENRTDIRGDVFYGGNYYNRYYPDRSAYNRDWYGYYGRHRSDAYNVSQRSVEWLEVAIESSLYELSDGIRVWSASLISDSDSSQTGKTIESVVKTLVSQMKKDRLW